MLDTTVNYEKDIDELSEQIGSVINDRARKRSPVVELKTEEFKRFRNIIHFVSDPEGLGLLSLFDYTRQYQYMRDFYSLICPACNTPGPDPMMPYDCWGKSPLQLQEEILFEINESGDYQCPVCQRLQKDMALPHFNELIGVAGMRSGKTVLSACILLYEIHCDLMLPNPQKAWGLVPGQEIYYTCCTTKGEQAKDTIFAAVDGIWTNSPWYTKYGIALKKQAEEQKIPFDRVFVKNLSEIRYLHKQLFVDVTGANSAGIAGKTRKVVVMDEIARFVQTDSRMGVDLVYDTLKNSLLTLSNYGSKMVCISSPMIKTDKIMDLYNKAVENKFPRVLVFHHPTWEFNPKLPFEHPAIQDEFKKNPTAAKRDFGADPPGALDPWMADEWRIDECVDPMIPALVNTQDYTTSLVVKGKQTDMVSKKILFKDFLTTKRIVISCDPGHRQDSFGMILSYIKPIRTVRGIEPHMFVGAALAWEPTKNPRREVDFANVLNLIKEMCKHWIVDKVVYDQWNSVLYIQDLQANGVDAEKIGLKPEDWDTLAALFYNNQIHMLHSKVGGHGAERLLWELKNLGLKENGKVDHAAHSSSDLAVCLARAAKVLVGPEVGQLRLWEGRARTIGRTASFRRP